MRKLLIVLALVAVIAVESKLIWKKDLGKKKPGAVIQGAKRIGGPVLGAVVAKKINNKVENACLLIARAYRSKKCAHNLSVIDCCKRARGKKIKAPVSPQQAVAKSMQGPKQQKNLKKKNKQLTKLFKKNKKKSLLEVTSFPQQAAQGASVLPDLQSTKKKEKRKRQKKKAKKNTFCGNKAHRNVFKIAKELGLMKDKKKNIVKECRNAAKLATKSNAISEKKKTKEATPQKAEEKKQKQQAAAVTSPVVQGAQSALPPAPAPAPAQAPASQNIAQATQEAIAEVAQETGLPLDQVQAAGNQAAQEVQWSD